RRLPLPPRLGGLPAAHRGTSVADLGGRLHLGRAAHPLRRDRPTPGRNPLMTTGLGASAPIIDVSERLGRLVSRSRLLDPGEVDDLLDVLGPDGFAWLRAGVGFVTAGVAARLPVEAGPDRFERAAGLVAGALRSIAVDGPSPI